MIVVKSSSTIGEFLFLEVRIEFSFLGAKIDTNEDGSPLVRASGLLIRLTADSSITAASLSHSSHSENGKA